VSAARDLLTNYQHIIKSLTFTMGDKGIFDVTVDGDLIYSKHETGRHANDHEVLELFTSAFADDVTRYGDGPQH
jgi:selenoprotein W-related protein